MLDAMSHARTVLRTVLYWVLYWVRDLVRYWIWHWVQHYCQHYLTATSSRNGIPASPRAQSPPSLSARPKCRQTPLARPYPRPSPRFANPIATCTIPWRWHTLLPVCVGRACGEPCITRVRQSAPRRVRDAAQSCLRGLDVIRERLNFKHRADLLDAPA